MPTECAITLSLLIEKQVSEETSMNLLSPLVAYPTNVTLYNCGSSTSQPCVIFRLPPLAPVEH